ncbi:MobC family plasmid mobilization relaxosome protein [Streptomyces sp. NBC_00433]
MRDQHHETPDHRPEQIRANPAPGGARYGAGPSNGRSHAGSSAPGVAEDLRRQGAPEGEADAEPSSLMRAAAEAAVRRTARRRRRDGTQRTFRVDVRYSQAEHHAIKTKAKAMEIAGAHLVGAVVMAFVEGTQPLPGRRTETDDLIDELVALRAQVAKIGGNVNQIAHRLNSGGQPHPADTALLAQAEHTVQSVRKAVAAIETAAHQAASRKAA